MPTTRPGFIWSGTEWIAIGQEAVVNPFYYQATAPTGAATGAIWIESDVDVPSIDSSQFLRWRKTMTGGETSLSGNDDSSLPLAYTPGYEQLYINGVLQVRGGDYTATTGTTVTGLTALVANDVVEIFSAVARTVADVYTQTQSDARFVNRNVGGLNLVVPTSVTGGTVSANGAVTFTSANPITINGCFNSTYENYKLIISAQQNSSNADWAFTLTSSGTAAASTWGAAGFAAYAAASGALFATNVQNAASATIMATGNGTYSRSSMDMYSPALAVPTSFTSNYISGFSGAGTNTGGFLNGYHNTASAYDGFRITPTSGTITGTIRVYGYNNGA